MKEKPVYFLDEEAVYDGNDPFFYNPSDYEWVEKIESNYGVIIDEFSEYFNGNKRLGKASINPPNLSSPSAWQNVYFWNFKWKKHKNCKKFPKTYALLNSIPNMIFAEVTMLSPRSSVLPHIGETNVTIRGHLGLKIPDSLPNAGIKVGDEMKSWEEGKVVLFSDAQRHTVWNHTDKPRFVLVFDVVKDEYANSKIWACAQSLGALSIKYFDSKRMIFKNLPKPFLKISHLAASLMWYLYLPFQNRLRFLP